ncbi:MAG: hypothetical protein AB1730_16940 [Myxococcota bacterium]|jgi:hypothetical protein
MGSHPLQSRFAQAALPLEVATVPFARAIGAEALVQLDIVRDRRGERFRLWPGGARCRIEVEGTDRRLQQLVLLVDEPKQSFEVEIGRWVVPDRPIVRREGHRRWVRHETEGAKRHFLMGLDEAHLFIAQLPRGVSTVARARELLRGPDVSRAERDAPFRTVRQGEWFLVALDPSRSLALDALAEARPTLVRHRVGIAEAARWARAGRQHVADDVLVLGAGFHLGLPKHLVPPAVAAGPGVFVRGKLRHPDHATIELKQWRRALPNAESFSRPAGVAWVD